MTMGDPIRLDGTTLEGGGQLFRLALSLSSIAKIPLHIADIRGKRGSRSKHGEVGGIKPAHLAGAAWLAKATQASTDGLKVKSKELTFCPSANARAAAPESDTGEAETNLWKDIFELGKLIRKESYISLNTPGSVFLILQAILPFALFSSAAQQSPSRPEPSPIPLRLTIEGGTNVWHSLSYEYADQVLFPMLHHKLGLSPIAMKLHKRGWSTGSTAVGRVQFDILPVSAGSKLPAFYLEERGNMSKFLVSIIAPDRRWRDGMRELVSKALLRLWPEVDIEFPVDEFSGHGKRVYLLIVAESVDGYRLGRDWLYDEKIDEQKPTKTMEKIVSKVVRDIEDEIDHGGCVDEWLQDQLVVFQTLAAGRSVIDARPPSLHTKTARWVAEQLLGVEFDESGNCEGVGFVADAPSSKSDIPDLLSSVAQMTV